MGKIMYGGRTYSEEVIPNPMGLPDADLNTIQIGDEIYKISGGGGGGGSDAYSQTLLWDYVDDNNGTVPYGTYSVTLHDDISKYDQLIVENISISSDVTGVDWNATTQYVIDVNALYNAYNPNYYLYTSFGERASRFHIVGTTFEKTTDNNSSIINGLVRVYGVKYIGGGGGDPYVDDIIWQSEGTTGVSGTVTVQTTSPLSDYDAAYTVQSTSTDGGYSDRFSTVICNVFKDETATNPVRVVQYPSYGNRYTILNSDFDNTEMQIQTGVYGESSGYTPIIYEVHGIRFGSGGGGGTDIEPNPQETPTDSLETIKIGNVVYDIPGGGGVDYKETIIYEASASADTYHLTSPLSNFDAIVCYAKYSGSVQGNFMVSSMFLVDKIETGVNYGICSDDWYTYFSKTDDSNLARSNQNKAFLYKIIGINFGGSSGNEEECDLLYKAQSTTPPNTITLSESVTDYDFLVTHIKSSVSGKATIGYTYTVDALSTGDIIGGELAAGNGWIWYTYTDSTTLTYLGVAQNYYIEEITGVKIGSGSGKVSKIETGEVLDITAGDGTTSRTFTLSKTPKFVSMSWAADSSWKYNGSFTWGSDRLYFSALDSSPALSGAYLGVSTITYGQDGKSFTITGGNAGGCANTSVTTGKLYVDYGEGIGKADAQSSSDYSTTEKVIGTWIDGKPLYQTTMSLTSSSSDGDQQVSLSTYGISDIDVVCGIEGTISSSSGGYAPLNYFAASNDRCNLYMASNNTVLVIAHYGSWSNSRPVYVTMKYTKTTDT